MNPRPDGLAIEGAEFRMFADLIRKRCGLHFGPESRYQLERRLAARVRELGLPGFAAYHYHLRQQDADQREFSELVDVLTNNETFFFREMRQLRGLISEILPELLIERSAAGQGPVTVWSAGCSSGEEPYTVVMLAREAGLEPGRELRVYASDISRRMLRRAREGVYRENSFRETDPVWRGRYFSEKDGLWRISDEIKRSVDFIHLNLLDEVRVALLQRVDVILCRNVLIYFDSDTRRRVLSTFYDRLAPGGQLLLGHAESLVNLSTDFALRHLKHDLVYQRPHRVSSRVDPWLAAAERALSDVDGEGLDS